MGDFNTSGAAQGAAAGASFGPWGALIGGVAGGFLGGDTPKAPSPVPLPTPNLTPNVSGIYGGMYRDPITGQISFTDTYNNPNFFQNYQNQALIDQLMGGTGTSANALTGLDTQMNAYQREIANLQKQQQQKIDPTKSGVLPEWLDEKGQLKPLNQILGEANNESSWLNKQYLALGGHYGSGGFAQFVKDAYTKNIQPAFDKYSKDLTTQQSSNDLIQKQIDAYNDKLAGLAQVKNQYAPGGQASQSAMANAAQNPMLRNISSMDELAAQMQNAAKSGGYLQQAQDQIGRQAENAMAQQQDLAARRGLAGSSVSELMRARLGLDTAGALNQANYQNTQNNAALLGQAGQMTQQALAARLGLMNNLQNVNNTAFNQGLQQQQLNLGQLQLGAGVGGQNAGAMNSWGVGNAAQQNQANMAGWNAGLAQQQQNANNWGAAAGAAGYGLANYFGQPSANYGIYGQGMTAQAPTSGSSFGMGTTGHGGYNWGDMPATTDWSSKLGGK